MGFLWVLFVLGLIAACTQDSDSGNFLEKPHIVLITLDDLGWADSSIYSGDGYNEVPKGIDGGIDTPNLNALASSGVKLANLYSQTVCSPSRTALLTGKFPFRVGMQQLFTLTPGSKAHLPTKVSTIAEKLKDKGYHTHMLGKWHQGYARKAYFPTNRGFDTFWGYMQGTNDYFGKHLTFYGKYGYDFWNGTEVDPGGKGTYALLQYMGEYERILQRYDREYPTQLEKRENPLFLYFAHQTIHTPLEARESAKSRCANVKDSSRRLYCEMMVEFDDAMNKTVMLLKENNLWDDTLLVLHSDNGGMIKAGPAFLSSAGSNYPFRGSKTTLFEGGLRVPGFVNGGKNVIPEKSRGSTYVGLMHLVDLAAIIMAVGEVNVTDDDKIDGINLLPDILYNDSRERRHEIPLNIINGGTDYTAIRFHDMKLIVGNPQLEGFDCDGWTWPNMERKVAPSDSGPIYLFNITNDPHERINLAHINPGRYKAIIEEGKNRIKKFMASGYVKPQDNTLQPNGLPREYDNVNDVWYPFLD